MEQERELTFIRIFAAFKARFGPDGIWIDVIVYNPYVLHSPSSDSAASVRPLSKNAQQEDSSQLLLLKLSSKYYFTSADRLERAVHIMPHAQIADIYVVNDLVDFDIYHRLAIDCAPDPSKESQFFEPLRRRSSEAFEQRCRDLSSLEEEVPIMEAESFVG